MFAKDRQCICAYVRKNDEVTLTLHIFHPKTLFMQRNTRIEAFGPDYHDYAVGKVWELSPEEPLKLDSGAELAQFPVAFQTYGELNAAKSNAILVCHGLTGDQYAASTHPVTGKAGWWQEMIGPDKPIDTNRFFVICTNVIGGCMGSFGPKSVNAKTGQPYALRFPVLTIHDMVRAQATLIDALEIETLFAVIGGSMGGMQALSWAVNYPDRAALVVPIATSARHSAQNIAFHEIGRQAIMADPDWCKGDYLQARAYPSKGLAVARMTAHVTYLSESALAGKFGRDLQDRTQVGFGFEADFQVESYLRYQGRNFVNRFDPNAYLYITRAMDYFDLAADAGGHLSAAFKGTKARFCVISFSSDWCFPTSESKALVRALNAIGAHVSFTEIESDKGHDAFLLDIPAFHEVLHGFLYGAAREMGL
jgi:homoserine O-acetyltransferase